MYSSHLKVFFSALAKQRLLALINVLGLSLGLASCLLLALYVRDEFSYDTQHQDADRLYRISSFLVGLEQNGRTPIPSASPLVGPLLKGNFPEVVDFTRIAEEPVYLSIGEEGAYEDEVRFVDANFFEIFRFEWLEGDPQTALSQPESIVLTETLAREYLGTRDPVGQELSLRGAGPLRVTGLIRDLNRTHLSGQAFSTLNELTRITEPDALEAWFGARFQVYVRLQPSADIAQLMPRMYDFIEAQMPPAASALYDMDSSAVTAIHLSQPQALGLNSSNRRQEVLALMLVCAALLGIACVNFINLSTVRSTQRGKEIAIRKVVGAERTQIFWQHLSESGWLVALSLLFALGIVELVLPMLTAFVGKQLSLSATPLVLGAILLWGFVVALIAGAYPALVLSRLRPTAVFKSVRPSTRKGHHFRNILVVLQFSAAIVLIVATSVIYLQVQFGKQLELGFNKERVLIIANELGERWGVLKEALQTRAGATQVSGAMNPPFKPIATSIGARYEGSSAQGENLSFFMVDFDYFELLEVEFIAGRSLSADFGGDRQVQPTEAVPHPGASLVINRAMADKLGWLPEDAIGKAIELNWSEDYSRSVQGTVVGVIENMHVDSLRREVVPLLYMVPSSVSGLAYGLVKLPGTDVGTALASIDAVWREIYPERPINRYFLDAEFQAIYDEEEKQLQLLAVFAALAIVISCLGLFALAAFTAERRSKEIGIRKTVGSSTWAVVLLLTNEFSKLVLLANLIAWPIAYLVMSRWLENFAYRIDLTPLIFIGSGAIALCIAWATVAGTTAKAASAKPVLALRYE